MICYNCPNWQPYNISTVDGYCTIRVVSTRADSECFVLYPSESEVETDEAL